MAEKTGYAQPAGDKQALKTSHLSDNMNVVLQGDDGVEYSCRLGSLREWLLKGLKNDGK